MLQLSRLNVQSFLVIFFFLNVLALNDFLCLLGDSVKLDIFRTLLKVNNLELQAFVFVLYLFEAGFKLKYLNHIGNFFISTTLNLFVFLQDNLLLNKNCILIICGNRQLWNFNLTLFQVDDHFKVVFKLFNSRLGLPFLSVQDFLLFMQLLNIDFKIL